MIKWGNEYISSGPRIKGQELTWDVKSQTNNCNVYKVSIAPKQLKRFKGKRDYYKNYSYKCTCENFEEIVSTYFNVLFGSNL